MRRRRRPFNWFWVTVMLALIAATLYFQQFVAPTIPTPGLPTPTATRSPESFLAEGQDLYTQGKLLQAIEAYRSAITADPQNAAAYITLAQIQVFAGRPADAQVSAENALLLNANNATANAVRGWAMASQPGGDVLAAEAAIKHALELDPNNALAHAYYAELLADQFLNGLGALDATERMSEESRLALSLGPQLMESHRARGYVLEATGNPEEALQEYQAALAITPNLADLYLSLGRNYRTLEVYDKAVEAFTRANTLNPSDPIPDLAISRIYAATGSFVQALQYAQQAVTDRPENTAYHGNLGVMYYKNNKFPEAIQELGYVVNGGITPEGVKLEALALESSARVPEYYFIYGLTLARAARCGEALPIAQLIFTRLPDDQIATDNAYEINRLCREQVTGAGSPTPETTPQASPTP